MNGLGSFPSFPHTQRNRRKGLARYHAARRTGKLIAQYLEDAEKWEEVGWMARIVAMINAAKELNPWLNEQLKNIPDNRVADVQAALDEFKRFEKETLQPMLNDSSDCSKEQCLQISEEYISRIAVPLEIAHGRGDELLRKHSELTEILLRQRAAELGLEEQLDAESLGNLPADTRASFSFVRLLIVIVAVLLLGGIWISTEL